MARPVKEGLDYFPLDVDIDQDDKISMIEALHGIEGFGILVKLLMKIYKEGYFYVWDKREQLLFSKRVNVDINTLNSIVNDCVNEGIFNKNIFSKYLILTSKGIQKRYLEAIKRRKEISFRAELFLIDDISSVLGNSNANIYLIDENNNQVNVNKNPSKNVNDDINRDNVDINTNSDVVNDEFSTQRKEKESKEKESKEKESKVVSQNSLTDSDCQILFQKLKSMIPDFIEPDEYAIKAYLDQGMEQDVILLAFQRTLMQATTPTVKYAKQILTKWFYANLKTVDQVEKEDPPKQIKERAESTERYSKPQHTSRDDLKAALNKWIYEGGDPSEFPGIEQFRS